MTEVSASQAPSLATLPHGRQLPRLGFGASSYWARPSFDLPTALAVLHAAVDVGINYIDTGPSYSDGEAERRVGELVMEVGSAKLVVSTKFGTAVDAQGRLYKDFHPKRVQPALHESLRRLKLERVDLLLLHSPTLADLTEDLMEALHRLLEQGLVGAIGLWSHEPSVHMAAQRLPFHVHMLQYNYSDRRAGGSLGCARQPGANHH